MNIKPMLIEKERLAYIAGDTALAEFFDATLQYILGLEASINTLDARVEDLEDQVEFGEKKE